VVYRDCEFEDASVDCGVGSVKPENEVYADVLIENCSFKKKIDAGGTLMNFTMRNSTFERLEFGGTVENDFLIEKIRGGALRFGLGKAKNIVFREGQLEGYENQTLLIRLGERAENLLVENVTCAPEGEDRSKERIGCYIRTGGKSATFKNVALPLSRWTVNTDTVSFEKTQMRRVTFLKAKAQKMQFTDTDITESANFTGATIQSADFSGLRVDEKNVTLTDSNLEWGKTGLKVKGSDKS
jgi:uncharacterized protein YjbI with pentapeptide repeats